MIEHLMGDAANLTAVIAGIAALVAFGWRVLQRLARIHHLLEQAADDHQRVARHERRIGVIERLLAITREE